MPITKYYYYLFYKFYKFWEYVSFPKFWSDWKAAISIVALEIWTLLAVAAYYAVLTRTPMKLSITMPIVYIPFLIIIGANYSFFIHSTIWKIYNIEFDRLSRKKNLIGSWIVFIIVLSILANLIYSLYLMSQVDWSLYR